MTSEAQAWGRVLVVDLETREICTEEATEEWKEKFLGGTGYAARMLLDELSPEEDPLSPKSSLAFMTGPVTGLRFPGAGRFEVSGRSPLTGLWGESSAGGFWGAELRFSGFDGVVVRGASEIPVFLVIRDGYAEIKECPELWGKDTFETEETLKEAAGKGSQVVCVGPAGENEVPIASIIHGKGHVAARAGLGALMGSKKLKAIVVRGTRKIEPRFPDLLARELESFLLRFRSKENGFIDLIHTYGTNGGMELAARMKDVPMQNWRRDDLFDLAQKVGGLELAKNYPVKPGSCFACPIACKRTIRIDSGTFRTRGQVPAPEYESAAALGPLTLLSDPEALCYANDLCNRLGLDTISAGSAIAFAMECKERGLLTGDRAASFGVADGTSPALTWGDPETVVGLVEDMAFKRGLGEILGMGVKRAAAFIGRGAEEFAIHSKGLEAPMHHPKASKGGGALAYATNPRGACHLQGSASSRYPGVSSPEEGLVYSQNQAGAISSAVMCNYVMMCIPPDSFAAIVSAATGKTWSWEDLWRVGERTWYVKRVYNLLCGLSPDEDRLPRRILDAIPGYDFERSLREYYRLRALDSEGVPDQRKLAALGIADVGQILAANKETMAKMKGRRKG
ncbi:MAG TPA: aldehyde ferredoxin oxidoreductase family protein [Firmicutes bacterium]|nr:aldehyde ferredoxin oxidoreductase family protein [Candidatus Fermentithermobacillaceae bacterium]